MTTKSSVVYIDSGCSFSSTRLSQMLAAKGLNNEVTSFIILYCRKCRFWAQFVELMICRTLYGKNYVTNLCRKFHAIFTFSAIEQTPTEDKAISSH